MHNPADMRLTALSIAGSDPSGGAGIIADIKTFALMGVYGIAVQSALTVQNTIGVSSVKSRPERSIKDELDALLIDVRPDAVKTGMLYSAGAVSAVAEAVKKYGLLNLVIDPVMISSSGRKLIKDYALERLTSELFPLAIVIMPNIAEAEALSGIEIKNIPDAEEAARIIRKLGPRYVLVKGGHMPGQPDTARAAVDVLFDGENFTRFSAPRIETEIHGAGCVYSAAVAAGLAKGLSVEEAVRAAKKFISKAIGLALPIGHGRVPIV